MAQKAESIKEEMAKANPRSEHIPAHIYFAVWTWKHAGKSLA